jgi:mannose-1-phosphate guanylyltransferase / mannose-6-phosphate isomerase
MTNDIRIQPVLLCGGNGSRLWPLSRDQYPKQFLALASQRSMLQDTALRVADPAQFLPPIVVSSQEHRFLVADQLRSEGITPAATLLEPKGRNTAPACAVAALAAERLVGGDTPLLVLPSDHVIADVPAFLAAVRAAVPAAMRGRLVTFGITPTGPETGYGYIRMGAPLAGAAAAHAVDAFVEKPDRATAEAYLAEGDYLWNSGMFLFTPTALIEELHQHAPEVLTASRAALSAETSDLGFHILDAAAFARAPAVSIDTGVMEKTGRAAVVPCSIGWNDIGAWSALWDTGARDERGNVGQGDVLFEDSERCYVRSDGQLTAVVGLSDAVVVSTDDAVLVAPRDRVQEVKAVVDRLRKARRSEAVTHRTVYRPWGSYRGLHAEGRFQVKCIVVAPGGRLSLQRHYHRAEHWIVVKGTALVTRGEEQLHVYENESVYIPIGSLHRLENPGKVPLQVIEVQSGSYLGEDDIVRLDDVYGRDNPKTAEN